MSETINIRGIDPELVRQAKVAAVNQGITLKQFVVNAIESALASEPTDIQLTQQR